jgi:hypothetical protein
MWRTLPTVTGKIQKNILRVEATKLLDLKDKGHDSHVANSKTTKSK